MTIYQINTILTIIFPNNYEFYFYLKRKFLNIKMRKITILILGFVIISTTYTGITEAAKRCSILNRHNCRELPDHSCHDTSDCEAGRVCTEHKFCHNSHHFNGPIRSSTQRPNYNGSVLCWEDPFLCDDASCIPNSFVCDGDEDCLRGEDEVNCNEIIGPIEHPLDIYPGCGDSEMKCNDGKCIPKR